MGEKRGDESIANKQKRAEQRGTARGRRPKPIDLHAALELTLIGSSLREQARQAGCSAKTLMGRYAQPIELAEARVCGLLKMRLYHLALVEENPEALLFLLQRIYDQKDGGQKRGSGKWSQRQRQQALRIVWRHTVPKPKRTYKLFRPNWRNPRLRPGTPRRDPLQGAS